MNRCVKKIKQLKYSATKTLKQKELITKNISLVIGKVVKTNGWAVSGIL